FVSGDGVSEHHSSTSMRVSEKFINDRLGLRLQKDEISELLKKVEFKIGIDDDGLKIHYPFWRTDIDEPEDIVEEVGRLYGYDRLPLELPSRSARPTSVNAMRELISSIRRVLMRAGANEVLTYSFVHERIFQAAG